ncbi:MAG: hypothetical protein ACRDBQ_18415 [Shewanella sp.]
MPTKLIPTAIEALMNIGFSFEEAQRIRPFMPKQFTLDWKALPATNPDAWYCYMAVQHYDKFGSKRGKFISHRQLSGNPFNTIEYRSDRDTLIFSEIEFLRYFGDAIFCNMKEGRRVPVIKDNALVIKNGPLKARLNEMERGGRSVFERWSDTEVPIGDFVLPCYPRNAKDVLEGVKGLSLLSSGYTGFVDTLTLSQYVLKAEESWDAPTFIHYRSVILHALCKRTNDTSKAKASPVWVAGGIAFDGHGRLKDVTITPYSKYTASTVVTDKKEKHEAPVIPPEIFTLYKEEEWHRALQCTEVHAIRLPNLDFDGNMFP